MKSIPGNRDDHKSPRHAAIAMRDGAPGDFQALFELDRVCYPRGIAYSKRELRWFLAQASAVCVVAESGGEIAGFLLADRVGTAAHIITIDVAPDQRRRGIGTTMLEEIERRLAVLGASEINLETGTENEAGTAFWQRHGYRTIGVLPGYYPGPQDAYAMSKSLTPRRP